MNPTTTTPLTQTSQHGQQRLHSDRWTTTTPPTTTTTYERLLGASEAAFYPASHSGLGDMFLHIAFSAPIRSMHPQRIALAWAIVRRRHPLLAASVRGGGLSASGQEPYFSFTPPRNAQEAVRDAQKALVFNEKSKDELIFEYMNGARTLSDDFLSYIVVSTKDPLFSASASTFTNTNDTSTTSENDTIIIDFDLLMCAPHFLGDGTSLHLATHDLLTLLASSRTDSSMEDELEGGVGVNWIDVLPPAFESRLQVPTAGFAKAVGKVDFARVLQREIGAHSLPRSARPPQRTILQEKEFTESETTRILQKCKSQGVTVNHAIVALCDVVWSRVFVSGEGREMPLMMYTAMNLRPYLSPLPSSLSSLSTPPSSHPTPPPPETYWFIALTYFNLVLPSFLPSTPAVFWHRARSVKSQIRKFVDSPFLKTRALEMADIRVRRSRGEVVRVATMGDLALPLPSSSSDSVSLPSTTTTILPPAPSTALLGLSLIGNLDALYTRASYPNITLHSVTTASRQKPSGLLLLEHTFGKKLNLHLCWDQNGFEQGTIERFWEALGEGVRECLM